MAFKARTIQLRKVVQMNESKVITLKHFTIFQLSELLEISTRTLWRWVSSGRFPQPDIKVGKVRRWKVETIEQWLAEQK